MVKNKLVVFIGKPGVGKTTLIKKIILNYKFIDVFPFIRSFEVNGVVPEEKTLTAYEKMYQYIDRTKNENIVLEIGTNHPELNVTNLEKLQKQYNVYLFLCQASNEICRQRANQRGIEFNIDALNRRLARDFPKSHLDFIKKTNLSYTILNMEEPIEKNINIINQQIRVK